MKAIQKFIRTSPRKLRLVADAVRSLKPEEALLQLKFMRKRAALPLSKTIKQALANAKQTKGLSSDKLLIKEIQINEGPTYKRWRPVSKGAAHSIMKRTSHIRIELEEQNGTKS